MASETNGQVETTVVEAPDVASADVFGGETTVVQTTVAEHGGEEYVVVETTKPDGSHETTIDVPSSSVATEHTGMAIEQTGMATSASGTSVASTDLATSVATAQSASMAIEEATRVLTAAGVDASSMPHVITQLVQLTQQQQQQQGQDPPTTSQLAANQAAILQALAVASHQTATTLVGTVPAAVQTVVLSANGAQQPQVAGRSATQAITQEMLAGKLQSPLTIQWLLEHFEIAEGMSLPRYALFTFYLDFCSQHGVQPVNAASFGKVIRQVFPIIKTRRLGTRGQSKYHYYGIGVKANSPYHSAMVTAARRQPPMSNKTELVSPGAAISTESKPTGQPKLAGFPDLQIADLSDEISRDKVSMFLMMYRAHCQSILDSVIRNNFAEIENFIIHFWSGMPEHLLVVLQSEVIANLVGECDCVLYRAIVSSILPLAIEPLSLTLTHSVRNFAKQLNGWIAKGCADMPDNLQKIKQQMGFSFTGTLRRRTSVSHLAQATRSVLQNRESVQQMLTDWKQLDLNSITYQSVSTFQHKGQEFMELYVEFMLEFEDLLEQQANVESFAVWLGSVVDRCVIVPARENEEKKFEPLARHFLLRWQFFTTRVVRDLTLRSALSFGSYHLLSMLFEDYILYLLEREIQSQKEALLQESIGPYFHATPDMMDEEEDEEAESPSPAASGAAASPAMAAVSSTGGGGADALQGMDATAMSLPTSSENVVIFTSSVSEATPLVGLTATVTGTLPSEVVVMHSTEHMHIDLATSTAAAAAADGPAGKRTKLEDDDDYLAESPHCTTPDPLMRSIGVGPNLPLDVSSAALLFPSGVGASSPAEAGAQ